MVTLPITFYVLVALITVIHVVIVVVIVAGAHMPSRPWRHPHGQVTFVPRHVSQYIAESRKCNESHVVPAMMAALPIRHRQVHGHFNAVHFTRTCRINMPQLTCSHECGRRWL